MALPDEFDQLERVPVRGVAGGGAGAGVEVEAELGAGEGDGGGQGVVYVLIEGDNVGAVRALLQAVVEAGAAGEADLAAVGDGGAGAGAGGEVGELEGRVAAAHDHHALGQGVEVQEVGAGGEQLLAEVAERTGLGATAIRKRSAVSISSPTRRGGLAGDPQPGHARANHDDVERGGAHANASRTIAATAPPSTAPARSQEGCPSKRNESEASMQRV